MKAQRDVKITSDLEARVITSFRTILPSILFGSVTDSSTEPYVLLSAKLKSYKDWHHDDGVSGVSQRILRGVVEVQNRVMFLASTSTTNPQLLRLANGMLIDCINFIQRLICFIDAWWIDLKIGSYFSETLLWEVIVSSIEQIFEDMRTARSPIQDASETDKSVLLWGLMKSHQVMKRYITNDFKKDPALNGILVQKILKSSPAAALASRTLAVERSMASNTSAISNLKTRMTTQEAKK